MADSGIDTPAHPTGVVQALQSLYDRIPAMMHSIDPSGRIVAVSDLWLQTMGYSRDQVVGHKSTEFLTPASRRFAEQEILPAFMRTGRCRDVPYEFVKSNGESMNVLLSAAADFDEQGQLLRSMAVLIDVTEWRRHQEALLVRREFERLITTISTRFVNIQPEETAREVDTALAEISRFSRVDRSWVFLVADERLNLRLAHEWCNEGIPSGRPETETIDVDSIPWGIGRLRRLETIHIPSVAALPPEAGVDQRFLHDQGIKSLLVVPMSSGGRLYGLVGFDNVVAEKTWDDDAIRLLRIAGEIFMQALERQRVTEELELVRDALEVRVGQRTAELAEANRRLAADRELLARKNAALEEMLDRVDRSQEQVTARIRANIDSLALPILAAMEHCVDAGLRDRVAILKQCLGDLSSSFAASIEAKYRKLSPREVEICNLVRSGMTCKEIAATLNTAPQTVLKQRKTIRRKLGIKGRDVNLTRHLKAIR